MNSQTKSVIKAAFIGLAISIALAALHAAQEGRVDPIDPYWVLNPEIMSHWIGKAGIIPLIFVIGTITFTFRKYSWWVSVLNLLGAVFGISVAVSLGISALAAVYPVREFPFAAAGPDREEFVQNAMAGCVRKQRSVPENRGVQDEIISRFCKCQAEASADITKREDIEYQVKYGSLSAEAIERLTASYNRCLESAK